MTDATRAIEITKLYVFGSIFPDPNDYNLHIRPADTPRPSITYDAARYMNNNGGSFALSVLFHAVQKILTHLRQMELNYHDQ
jgi:hypothetical protein